MNRGGKDGILKKIHDKAGIMPKELYEELKKVSIIRLRWDKDLRKKLSLPITSDIKVEGGYVSPVCVCL